MIRRRRVVPVVALTVALGLALPACGFPTESTAEPLPDDAIPSGLRPEDSGPTTTAVEAELIDVWFVSGDGLSSVRHSVAAPATTASVLTELLEGPTEVEQGRALRTAIPDAAAVIDVTVARGVATVTLAPEFASIPASDQVLAVGQLVLTLTDLRGIGRVGFVVNEVAVAVPLPSGETSDSTVSRDEFIVLAEA